MAEVLPFNCKTLINNRAKVKQQISHHSYSPTKRHSFICSVCGDYSYKENEMQNVNLLNQYRLATGGLCQVGMGPVTLAFYLDQFSRLQSTNHLSRMKKYFGN